MYSFLDGLQCAYNSNKSKYENRMNYKNMTEEEITYQLEWSDENEFGTNYAKFLREENKQLKSIITELEEWLKEQWYEIEPKGTGINFNCEYDSEEDYVRGMETKSKLDTLKNTLKKIQKLKEKYK